MKNISKILPWVIIIAGIVYYFSVIDPNTEKLKQENERRKIQADSAIFQSKLYEARADSLQEVKEEVITEIIEIEKEETRTYEKSKKDIRKFVIDAHVDSLLLTGKALSDSINRTGYVGAYSD